MLDEVGVCRRLMIGSCHASGVCRGVSLSIDAESGECYRGSIAFLWLWDGQCGQER